MKVLAWALFLPAFAHSCSLDCQQSAPCVTSSVGADFSDHIQEDGTVHDFHQETSRNNEYCSCPHGWTGLLCDVKFEGCDGNHTCYHGGQCIPGLKDAFGNEQLYCSCENAVDEAGNRYVGRFCEHASADAPACSDEEFCVNGGVCNPNFPSNGDPCNCADGFTGPHCEYKVGTTPDCDLECENGGRCFLGSKELLNDEERYQYWDHRESKHMYCRCPEGFDGPNCEIKKESCGENHCFNGGKCVEREVDGSTLHHCDCSETNRNGDVSFAGRYCQYEATSYCSKTSGLQGHLFCVNNGMCKSDPYDGCSCPSGFTGFSCEYVTSAHIIQSGLTNDIDEDTDDDDDFALGGDVDNGKTVVDIEAGDEPCTLTCGNGGVCRNGFKESSTLNELESSAFAENHQDLQHCVCTDGWAGVLCDIEVDTCDSNKHMCFHGGKCSTFEDRDECDCSSASTASNEAFSGRHCEHGSTQICTEGDRSPGTPLSFCVNGASCLRMVSSTEEHAGCNCKDGWTGKHCEVREGLDYDDDDDDDDTTPLLRAPERPKSHRAFGIVVLFFSITAICVVGAFMYNQRRRRQERDNNALSTSMRWENSYTDKPKPINIAPRRSSTITEDREEDDIYMASVASPNRDPMATHLAPAIDPSETEPDVTFGEEDTPKIYIGPPRDEDGHELHSVNII